MSQLNKQFSISLWHGEQWIKPWCILIQIGQCWNEQKLNQSVETTAWEVDNYIVRQQWCNGEYFLLLGTFGHKLRILQSLRCFAMVNIFCCLEPLATNWDFWFSFQVFSRRHFCTRKTLSTLDRVNYLHFRAFFCVIFSPNQPFLFCGRNIVYCVKKI